MSGAASNAVPSEASSRGRFRRAAGRTFERGAALLIVLALVLVALSVTALLVAASMSARSAQTEREENIRLKHAGEAALNTVLESLYRGGDGCVDGNAGSLASIRPASGPPRDLRNEPDGSFTVRSERRMAPDGPEVLVTAYAKWGTKSRGLRAVAAPINAEAFPSGFFGDEGLSIAGRGRVDAIDSTSAEPEAVLAAQFAGELLGSNGDMSLGSSSATGGGSSSGGRSSQRLDRPSRPGATQIEEVEVADETPVGVDASPAGFVGSILAPRCDIHVRNIGRPTRPGTVLSGLEVRGDARCGPGLDPILGPAATVLGVAEARRDRALLPAVRIRPPDGLVSLGSLAIETDTTLPAGASVYDSLSILAGTVTVKESADLYVLGDLVVSGRVVLEGTSVLRLFVAGGIRIHGSIENPGPATRLSIVCAADSVARPNASVDLFVRRGVVGAMSGRTLKVTGTPVLLRHDRAVAAAARAATPVRWRIRSVVEIAAQ